MILSCCLFFAVDIGTVYNFYCLWIKKNGLLQCFPHWENTNKNYIWWITWSIILFTNLLTFIIVIIFCFPFVEGVLFGFIIIYPAATILIGVIYFIVKHILIIKQKKC